MIDQLECPGCHGSLMYSPALAGRTVRCHLCEYAFAVAALIDQGPVPPPLPTARIPPPLPPTTEQTFSKHAAPLPAVDILDDDKDVMDEERVPPRSNNAKAVLGILAIYLLGFLVMASGIGYLIWPGSSRPTSPATHTVAPPEETPFDVERPKSLKEVLNEGSDDKVPPKIGNPGIPKRQRRNDQ